MKIELGTYLNEPAKHFIRHPTFISWWILALANYKYCGNCINFKQVSWDGMCSPQYYRPLSWNIYIFFQYYRNDIDYIVIPLHLPKYLYEGTSVLVFTIYRKSEENRNSVIMISYFDTLQSIYSPRNNTEQFSRRCGVIRLGYVEWIG